MPTGAPFAPAAFPTTVVVPEVASAYRRVPYLSISEYRFAPTAVSTQQLVAKSANPNDADASLARVIERASAWADLLCFHRAEGTLAASVTTEKQWVTPKPDGSLALICNFKPIREVVGLALGSLPSNLANVSANTAQNIWPDGKVIYVPSGWAVSNTGAALPFAIGLSGTLFAVWAYVSGFAHGSLAVAANKNDTSITVTPAVPGQLCGIYAGSQLTINDGDFTETVLASAAPSGTTVTLQSGLQFAHSLPSAPDFTRVSSIPRAVDEAVISLVSVLVKVQGSRAMQMPQVGGGVPSRPQMAFAGGLGDFDNAVRLLKPFTVVTTHG